MQLKGHVIEQFFERFNKALHNGSSTDRRAPVSPKGHPQKMRHLAKRHFAIITNKAAKPYAFAAYLRLTLDSSGSLTQTPP